MASNRFPYLCVPRGLRSRALTSWALGETARFHTCLCWWFIVVVPFTLLLLAVLAGICKSTYLCWDEEESPFALAGSNQWQTRSSRFASCLLKTQEPKSRQVTRRNQLFRFLLAHSFCGFAFCKYTFPCCQLQLAECVWQGYHVCSGSFLFAKESSFLSSTRKWSTFYENQVC